MAINVLNHRPGLCPFSLPTHILPQLCSKILNSETTYYNSKDKCTQKTSSQRQKNHIWKIRYALFSHLISLCAMTKQRLDKSWQENNTICHQMVQRILLVSSQAFAADVNNIQLNTACSISCIGIYRNDKDGSYLCTFTYFATYPSFVSSSIAFLKQ